MRRSLRGSFHELAMPSGEATRKRSSSSLRRNAKAAGSSRRTPCQAGTASPVSPSASRVKPTGAQSCAGSMTAMRPAESPVAPRQPADDAKRSSKSPR